MHKKNQYDEIKVCLHNLIFGSQTAEQSKAKISQFFFWIDISNYYIQLYLIEFYVNGDLYSKYPFNRHVWIVRKIHFE